MPLTNMTRPDDYRNRLLADARALVCELELDQWEGCTVRELVISLQATLDEDEPDKKATADAFSA